MQEDYGWKLVHADVFRPPTRPMLLSVLVGSGSQLIAMAGLTLGNTASTLYGTMTNWRLLSSVCCPWIPFSFEPRLPRNDDGDLFYDI